MKYNIHTEKGTNNEFSQTKHIRVTSIQLKKNY